VYVGGLKHLVDVALLRAWWAAAAVQHSRDREALPGRSIAAVAMGQGSGRSDVGVLDGPAQALDQVCAEELALHVAGRSLRRLPAASSRLMFVMLLSLPSLGWGRTKEEG